jgi:hypothetical protein
MHRNPQTWYFFYRGKVESCLCLLMIGDQWSSLAKTTGTDSLNDVEIVSCNNLFAKTSLPWPTLLPYIHFFIIICILHWHNTSFSAKIRSSSVILLLSLACSHSIWSSSVSPLAQTEKNVQIRVLQLLIFTLQILLYFCHWLLTAFVIHLQLFHFSLFNIFTHSFTLHNFI